MDLVGFWLMGPLILTSLAPTVTTSRAYTAARCCQIPPSLHIPLSDEPSFTIALVRTSRGDMVRTITLTVRRRGRINLLNLMDYTTSMTWLGLDHRWLEQVAR
jgi:hypothetical protein